MSVTPNSLAARPRPRRIAVASGGVGLGSAAGLAGRVLAIVALFFLASVAGLALYGYTHVGRVYEGVAIAGVNVGGQTEAEARASLTRRVSEFAETTLVLHGGEQTFPLAVADAGATFDVDASVRAAMAVGRSGSWWARSRAWADAIVHGADVPLQIDLSGTTLTDQLRNIAEQVTRPPVDARIDVTAGSGPTIVPEEPGVALDLAATRERIVDRLRWLDRSPVVLVTPPAPPAVTAGDLEGRLDEVSAAVGSPLYLSGLGQYWSVPASDLARVVSVSADGEHMEVDRNAIRRLIREIAAVIEGPSVDASVVLDENRRFVALPGRNSVVVNAGKSVSAVVDALMAGERVVPLIIRERPPRIGDAAAERAADDANRLIGDGVRLSWDGGEATLTSSELAAAVVVESRPGDDDPFAVSFDRGMVGELLQPLADSLFVPAREPQLRLEGSSIKVVGKGAPGQAVDIDAAVDRIIDALIVGQASAELPVVEVEPVGDAAAAKRIALDDVLAEASTYYGNSSDARRKNVERATTLLTGWLVAPGDEFSYVELIGDVTKKAGFVTGFGIVASPENDGSVTTAPVVGGGICQVSTTIFQAAFWAGLPIAERHEHPYWLQNYGEPPRGMKGLDAMVNIEDDWSLDLRFTNTTGNWIAVVILADGENVTARIVGVDPGWDVRVDQPVITEVVTPESETFYYDSPELPLGSEQQVETAQEGFTASVHRVVLDRDGDVIDETTLTSTYAPARNTVLRGTGAESNG